jgi:hypothetical protein
MEITTARYAVMLRPIQIERDGTYPGIVTACSVYLGRGIRRGRGLLFIVMRADLQPSASAPVIFRCLTEKC